MACIHTYIHTYIHTDVRMYGCTDVRTDRHTIPLQYYITIHYMSGHNDRHIKYSWLMHSRLRYEQTCVPTGMSPTAWRVLQNCILGGLKSNIFDIFVIDLI